MRSFFGAVSIGCQSIRCLLKVGMTIHWWLLPPLMVLSAFCFRVRGGMLERYRIPGQVSRMTWVLSCAVTAWAAGLAWWASLELVPLMFLAATLPLWSSMDMGRNQGSFAQDFALGSLHGCLMGACAAALLLWLNHACAPLVCWTETYSHWWIALIGGTAWGACYALAWLRPAYPELVRWHMGKDGSPPECAELLFGNVFAAALFCAVALT